MPSLSSSLSPLSISPSLSLSPSVSSSPSSSSSRYGDYYSKRRGFFKSKSFKSKSKSSSNKDIITPTKIRIMFVSLLIITVWSNTKNSIYITSTLSFIAFDRQQHQIQQIQQGCAGDNKTNSTAISTYKKEKRSRLLTSQTYVISSHSEKVTTTFRNRNLYTGFYGTNDDNDNSNDDVIWFPSVNGSDPMVLTEWNDITTNNSFPLITPDMGRNGFIYPFLKTDPYYEQGLENSTNSYISPHVIGCYESHRQLLTFISENIWNDDNKKDEEKNNEDDDNEDNKDDDNIVEQTTVLLPLPVDAIFIFEDDSVCVDDTKQYILNELIPKLPTTWDILYIGGKPFSYLDNNRNNNYESNDESNDNNYVGSDNNSIFQTKEERDHFLKEKELCDYSSGGDRRFGDRGGGALCPIFRQYACEGKFGTSFTGPFGATTATSNTTSRTTFHPNQPYWKTNYILDTHAYVINPKHIQKVINILNDMVRISNPIDNFRPIDITLADNMNSNSMNSIQAYLPSKGEYCKQVPHDYDYDQKQQEQRQNEQEQEKQELQEQNNQDQKQVISKIKIKQHNANANGNGNADTDSKRSNVASKRIKSKPIAWEGYYHHNDFGVIWEELYFEDCPESYSNGLL